MHNYRTDIEFAPAKAKANLAKHKVSFAQAEEALRDPRALTIEDPNARGEPRYITLGMDVAGRPLVVIHTPRKASNSEAEKYHA